MPKTDYLTAGCSRELTFKAHFLAALPVFTGKEESSDQLSAVAMRKLAENVLHLKGHVAATGSSIFTLKNPSGWRVYVCSAQWHRESGGLALFLNKQPLQPLQLNPNTASSSSARPLGKAEHKSAAKAGGAGRGEICCWLSENPWHIFGYGLEKGMVEGLAT